MAKLETLSRYKALSSNDDVRYLAPDITQEAISNWKPEEKIPVIILEEKYTAFDGNYFQNLSGLDVVYEYRKTGYGGPLVVLSIFDLDQVEILVRFQYSRFKEKTHRILRTSNINFVCVRENDWNSNTEKIISETKSIIISNFSRTYALRYATQHTSAVTKILHDLKNALLLTENENTTEEIEKYLKMIADNHIDRSKIQKFIKEKLLFSKQKNVDKFKVAINDLLLTENQVELSDKNERMNLSIEEYHWDVLVIEDNKKIAQKINKSLKNEGFKSCYVTSPSAAIDKIKTMRNLVWVVSDYHLEDVHQNWYALQGIDLLLKIQKAQNTLHKKIHLTILTSKRDILTRAHWTNFSGITFFNKSILKNQRDYKIFIETQLPHLFDVYSYNENKFITPTSWKTESVDAITIRLNSKKFRSMEASNDVLERGNHLLRKFEAEYSDEIRFASWNYIWTKISAEDDWNDINGEINKVVEGVVISKKSVILNHYKIILLAKIDLSKDDWKTNVKHRLIVRRLCLVAFVHYTLGKYPENNFSNPVDLFNNFLSKILKKQKSTQFNHFRSSSGFEPIELFSGFELQYKSIPQEERSFLELYFESLGGE
jgi:CheY-like chemotaxis protein